MTTTDPEGRSSSPPRSNGGEVDRQEVREPAGPAPVPPSGLWEEALSTLSEKEQKSVTGMRLQTEGQAAETNGSGSGSPSVQIEDLISLTKKRQSECERKGWKFKVKGNEIILRDVAAKIITVLSAFKEVGDNIAGIDPVYVALPWAAVRFFIQSAEQEKEQMYSLLSITETISRVASRGSLYEQLYLGGSTSSTSLNSSNSSTYTDDLRQALIKLYAAALRTVAKSCTLLAKNTAKRMLSAVFNPSAVEDLVSELSDHERDVQDAVRACQALCDADNSRVAEELQAALDRMGKPLFRVDERVASMLAKMDINESLEILEWVSPVPFGCHHDSIQADMTEATCEWVIQDPEFRKWHSSSASAILGLYGSPGTGKTFLTSRVVEWMKNGFEETVSDEAFAYFYCNKSDPSRRELVHILRSILRQLSTTANSDDPSLMHPKLRTLWLDGRKNGSNISLTKCKQELLTLFKLYPKTTLVLDALDECDMDTQIDLLEFLNSVISKSSRPIGIFISSRKDPDIVSKLEEWPSITIRATDNHDDIAKFINARIIRHRSWSRMPKALREEIVTTLLEKSNGMFMWTNLQIRQILAQRTLQAIRDRLGKLPENLETAYDEIYGNIEESWEADRQIADRAFEWVMCAAKPLKGDELVHAVCQDPESDAITTTAEEITRDVILGVCQNLLVFDDRTQTWSFAHLSVAEYLEKHHYKVVDAHAKAAKVTMSWVLKIPLPSEGDDGQYWNLVEAWRRMEEIGNEWLLSPMSKYSVYCWWIHVKSFQSLNSQSQGRDQDGKSKAQVRTLLRTFFGKPETVGSPQFQAWDSFLRSLTRIKSWKREAWMLEWSDVVAQQYMRRDAPNRTFLASSPSPVFTACMLGFQELFVDWWADDSLDLDEHFFVPSKDDFYGRKDLLCPLLSVAIASGCEGLWRHLLAKGAEVNPEPSIDIRFPVWPPLAAATWCDNTEAAQTLLEKGADVNVADCPQLGSPLIIAAAHGSTEMANALLQGGADVNQIVGEGCWRTVRIPNALCAACVSRIPEEMISLLLEAGADLDIDLTDESKPGTVLAYAVRRSYPQWQMYTDDELHRRLVEALLDAGANVNPVPRGELSTPFIALASEAADSPELGRHKLDLCSRILAKGAEVNGPATGLYGWPLLAAAQASGYGQLDLVRLLLEEGSSSWKTDIQSREQYCVFKKVVETAYESPEEKVEVMSLLLEASKGEEGRVPWDVWQVDNPLNICLDACSGRYRKSWLVDSEPGQLESLVRILQELVSHGGFWDGDVEQWKVEAAARNNPAINDMIADTAFWQQLQDNLLCYRASLVTLEDSTASPVKRTASPAQQILAVEN